MGNLAYATTDESLRAFFESAGAVKTAEVVMDRERGRSKGFGFVEMMTAEEAQTAISRLEDQGTSMTEMGSAVTALQMTGQRFDTFVTALDEALTSMDRVGAANGVSVRAIVAPASPSSWRTR